MLKNLFIFSVTLIVSLTLPAQPGRATILSTHSLLADYIPHKSSTRRKKVSKKRAYRITSRKRFRTGASSKKKAFTVRKIKESLPLPSDPLSGDFRKNKGKLEWPVADASIKVRFGKFPIPGTHDVFGNNPGLTIETGAGNEVRSVFEGKVTSLFNVAGDQSVIISHGGYYTTYSKLADIAVTQGETVKAGQVLGVAAVNDSGKGEIEFLLMQEKENLNPELWLKKKVN